MTTFPPLTDDLLEEIRELLQECGCRTACTGWSCREVGTLVQEVDRLRRLSGQYEDALKNYRG